MATLKGVFRMVNRLAGKLQNLTKTDWKSRSSETSLFDDFLNGFFKDKVYQTHLRGLDQFVFMLVNIIPKNGL